MIRIIISLISLCVFSLDLLSADLPLVDPMRPDNFSREKPKSITKQVVKKQRKRLILQQTVVSPDRRFAIINGFMLSEGERVKGGFRVFQINDDNVILIRNNKEFVLNLAGGMNIKELSR